MIALAKGLDPATHRLLTDVIVEATGHDPSRVAPLSGPNHAEEIAAGQPAASVVASSDPEIAPSSCSARSRRSRFRVYASSDVRGVQLCGAAKNVIAIAAGICDGLGYGDNARAALITRGLAEMTRLGSALGADPRTYAGLAGLGDLVATCTSRHSRNRAAGELLARGVAPGAAEAEVGMVVEGLHTAPALAALAREAGVDLPITEAVCSVIAGASIPEALARPAGARRARRRVLTEPSRRPREVRDRRGRADDPRERVEHVGVEEVPAALLEDRQRLRLRDGAAVDALAGERVVDVADAQDAHLERELLAAQAVGVAAAVEPLVVPAHERQPPRRSRRCARAAPRRRPGGA